MPPVSRRAELARIDADLAAARLRRDDLAEEWGYAAHAAGWSRRAEDVEVEQARVEAEIVALKEKRDELTRAPANDVALVPASALPAPAPAAPRGAEPTPAAALPEPAAALPEPECVDTREAAALLGGGISPRTLEGLRLRGEGPPYFKLGRRVLYPLATLRSWQK